MSHAVAVFDVDKTLVQGSSGGCLIDYVMKRNRLPAANRRLMMREMWLYKTGQVPKHRLIELGARAFFGLRRVEMIDLGRRCMAEVLHRRIHREALDEIRRCRREGKVVVLASGSPSFIVEPLGAWVGADLAIGSRCRVEGGVLTDEAIHPLPFEEGKPELVEAALAERGGIDWGASAGYSDRDIDLPLLGRVGRATAVNPCPVLRSTALERGWRLERWRTPVGDAPYPGPGPGPG